MSTAILRLALRNVQPAALLLQRVQQQRLEQPLPRLQRSQPEHLPERRSVRVHLGRQGGLRLPVQLRRSVLRVLAVRAVPGPGLCPVLSYLRKSIVRV